MTKTTNRILKITFCVLLAIVVAIGMVICNNATEAVLAADDTPTTASSTEVGTEDALRAAFENGGKVKLVGDITLTESLTVSKTGSELDLNGYVLSGGEFSFIVSGTETTDSVLVLKDSNPTATHTAHEGLPVGGVINAEMQLTTVSGKTTKAYLYANGGTVSKQLKINTSYAQVDCNESAMTVFKDGADVGSNKNAIINAGLYYGGVTGDHKTDNVKVEFKNGNDVYATQFVKIGNKAACPINPSKDGYTFLKWYNGENNDNGFSNPITSTLTLKAMWIKEVGTLGELKEELGKGNSVKLTADIVLTDNVSISSGQNITIDLNGHVISSEQNNGVDTYQLKGTGGGGKTYQNKPTTMLTIIDSDPTATHSDFDLLGGYVNVKINITASSNTQDTGFFNLHANGGTIKNIHCPSYACYIIWSGGMPSVIKSVTGTNNGKARPTCFGGLYYCDINKGSTAIKVAYEDGGSAYAALIMDSESPQKTALKLTIPAKEDYVFDGWYNGDDKYDFSAEVTGDITLTAKWVEDTTAPVIGGVVDGNKYCTNKEITVQDVSLDKVTVNGEAVTLDEEGKFTLVISEGADSVVIVAMDKALNSTTVTVSFGHSYGEWIEEVPATVDEFGTKAHKDCAACGKHFDADGNEIENIQIDRLAPSLSEGAIAGIIIGSVAVVGVGGFAIFWFVIKKRKWADLISVFKNLFAKK